MIGGLETPTAGVLTIDGKDISTYSEAEMVRYRRDKVGFVWQKSAKNLFPYLTVLQNVEAVMMFENAGNTDNLKHGEIIKKRKDNNKSYALKLLNAVGLQEHKDKLPAQLSGGEQQRAAIAVHWQISRTYCLRMSRPEPWIQGLLIQSMSCFIS